MIENEIELENLAKEGLAAFERGLTVWKIVKSFRETGPVWTVTEFDPPDGPRSTQPLIRQVFTSDMAAQRFLMILLFKIVAVAMDGEGVKEWIHK